MNVGASLVKPSSRRKFADWQAGTPKQPIVSILAHPARLTGFEPPPITGPIDPETLWLDFPARLRGELQRIEQTRFLGDAFPLIFVNFGAGVLGACMGGNYSCDYDTFWYGEPVLHDLGEIENFPVRAENVWWRRVQEYTDYLLEQAHGRYLVTITDIGGGMDILAGLRGTQQLHMDLLLDPAGVCRALEFIYAQWEKVFGILTRRLLVAQGAVPLWTLFCSEAPCYILQNDFSCMISPEQFREMDLPFLRRLASRIDCGLYHLDGPGALRHLEALLEIPALRSIQWVPGAGQPGGAHWNDLSRRILAAGKGVERCLMLEEIVPFIEQMNSPALFLPTYTSDIDGALRLEATLAENGWLE